MVSKDYKPSMKPKLLPSKMLGETKVPAQIQVSWEYGNSLKLTDKEQEELKTALNGESLCPRLYWFEDTPRVREILRVERAEKEQR